MAQLALNLDRFSSRKFVLSVGDEGAILIYMQGARVLRRLYAPGPGPQERKILEELFKVDTKAPITILMDVMDQSYVQQTLPPVSALSVNKLIQRRLERDFPPEDIKGAITLGRAKEGRKDWNFLFVSLANLPPASEWLEFVMGLPNQLKGVHMLPVEAQGFIADLHRKLHGKGKPPEWQLLVSHNKVGGFRQVVLRDGRLAFTRLAQPIGESIPEVIAGNIEQEIQNTTEYLKRLGFKEDSELSAYILVSEDIKQVIDTKSMRATEVHIFTPFEVAQMMKLSQAAQEQDHFGDVVLAAAFGVRGKPLLKMTTQAIQRLEVLHDLSAFARLARLALVPLSLATFTWQAYDLVAAQKNIEFSQTRKAQAQAGLSQIQTKAKELPYDLEKMVDALSLYDRLSEGDARPLTMIADFGMVMTTKDMLLKSIQWDAPPVATGPRTIAAGFDVEFAPVKNLETLLNKVRLFQQALKAKFEGYEIVYTTIPGVAGGNETWEQSFGAGQKQDIKISSNLVLTIKGTGVKKPAAPGSAAP